MAEESFQLPRSPHDEIKHIIVAYGHLNEPDTLQDVSEYGGMSTTTVSRNNGFLISLGIVEPGQKKGPTTKGQRLADAIEHDIPEEVAKGWQEVIADSDFLQKVLAAVKIRKGMERSALEAHIAYTAGEKKTGRVMTGAAAIVDMLMEAKVLKQEDGKLVVQEAARASRDDEGRSPRPDQFAPSKKPSQVKTHQTEVEVAGHPRMTIKIDVSVSCTVEEMEKLGDHLRSLIEKVRSVGAETDEDADLQED